MFPDTAYGFVSGGDPASIPALTYEKYVRVYRRHYSADNCCITLYGKMDMAEKLAFLDEQYLSHMPKSVSRPPADGTGRAGRCAAAHPLLHRKA